MTSSSTPLTETAKLFNSSSALYDRHSGDTTRSIARFMLSLPPTPDEHAVVLDNACGTGALSFELLNSCPSPSGPYPKIHAVDVAPAMVDFLRQKANETHPQLLSASRLETDVMDGQDLAFPDDAFTHSYMNFGIMFLRDEERGAAEIFRTLRTGGAAFVSTWESLGYMPLVLAAQKAVRPHDEPWKAPYHEEWHTEEKLRTTLVRGGFAAEKVRVLRKKTTLAMESLDVLVDTFLLPFSQKTQGWSEEEKGQIKESIRGNMTDVQKQTVSVDMNAFVALAEK